MILPEFRRVWCWLLILELSIIQLFYLVEGFKLLGIKSIRTHPDNRILWDVIGPSWHLMSFSDIFFGRERRQNSMKMPWHFDGIQQDFLWEKGIPVKCHENVMKFQCHSMGLQNFGSFRWYFYGKRPWNCHRIWRHFRPKLRWDEMMAFYYEGNTTLIYFIGIWI